MNLQALNHRLRKLREALVQMERDKTPIAFKCYFEGEHIPDDGLPVIRTVWVSDVDLEENEEEDASAPAF